MYYHATVYYYYYYYYVLYLSVNVSNTMFNCDALNGI